MSLHPLCEDMLDDFFEEVVISDVDFEMKAEAIIERLVEWSAFLRQMERAPSSIPHHQLPEAWQWEERSRRETRDQFIGWNYR
jgi:hypothetical protein